MGLNSTPSGERLHIGFFGCRNVGKSSIVNAVTGQELAVVSDVKGTTTDPVMKAMELLPLGPVMIIDTPGFDDEGELGEKRILKTKQILNKTDVAVLVADAASGLNEVDKQLQRLFEEKQIPYVITFNKSDLMDKEKFSYADPAEKDVVVDSDMIDNEKPSDAKRAEQEIFADAEVKKNFEEDSRGNVIFVSALKGENINELKELIGSFAPKEDEEHRLLSGVCEKGDVVILVCPIDESAPKGRLILPQQQAIRDCLDFGAMAMVCTEKELEDTLKSLSKKPKIVITDSQAFKEVDKITPSDISLTSFSILMARYKGFLDTAVAGVQAIDELKDGSKVLMAEGCTHHRQCNDIGTVKIPNWLRKYSGKNIEISTCSGREFPDDLSEYDLIIHCGGCMLTERDVKYRMKCATDQNVPFANYGITIAKMTGTLKRSLEPIEK